MESELTESGPALKAAAFEIPTMAGGIEREIGRPLHVRGLVLQH